MTGINRHVVAGLATTILLTQPASANPASDALDSYFEMMTAYGADIAVGDKSESGDSAVWRDVVVSARAEIEGEAGGFEWRLPSISAEARGNGIGVELAERSTFQFDVPEDDVSILMEMLLSGQDLLIVEDGGELRTTYNYDMMTLRSLQNSLLRMDATIDDLSGVQLRIAGAVPRLTGSQAIGSMRIIYGIDDPSAEVMMNSDIAYGETQVTYAYDHVPIDQMIDYVTGDRAAVLEYSSASTTSDIEFADPSEGTGRISSKSGPSSFKLALDAGQFEVIGEGSDISYDAMIPGGVVPPISMSMDKMEMGMDFAVGEVGEETRGDMLLRMAGVAVPENLWAIFDPTQRIPRDPLDFTIDMGAVFLWTADLMESMDSEEPPVEPKRVELRDLTLSAGGATIFGEGAADIAMMGPVPMPTGKLNLDFKGAMTLLTTLTEMGLVPPEQAMMARMFSQTMARQGPDGGDHLVTEIEARADGAVLVNGNRMR